MWDTLFIFVMSFKIESVLYIRLKMCGSVLECYLNESEYLEIEKNVTYRKRNFLN